MTIINLAEQAAATKLNDFSTPVLMLNELEAYVSRFTDHPKWEINRRSDKLIVGIAGRMRITILDADGTREHIIGPGEMMTIHAGTWHSPEALGEVSALTVCDYRDTTTTDVHPDDQ